MIPCNSRFADTSEGSACYDPRDACTTSGMYLGESGYTYRGGSTDQAFTSNNCPSYCLAGNNIPRSKIGIQYLVQLTSLQTQFSIRDITKAQTSTHVVLLACSSALSAVVPTQTRYKIVADPLSPIQDPDTLCVPAGTPKNFSLRLQPTPLSRLPWLLRHPQSLRHPG